MTPILTAKRKEAEILLHAKVLPHIPVKSRENKILFQQLTGTSHDSLVTNWRTGGIMTACNGFAAWYAAQLGIRLNVPKGQEKVLGWFKLEPWLKANNMQHAWVPSSRGIDPRYGDILHHKQGGTGLHVDVCVGFTEDHRLIRVGAGQTSFSKPRKPDAETDILTRVVGTTAYEPDKLHGWLDLEVFFDPAAVGTTRTPGVNWLVGWWDVVQNHMQYYYHFDASGHVQYTKIRPANASAPPKHSGNAGTYHFRFVGSNEVIINWNPLDDGFTEEKFTATDASHKRMEGESSRYEPLLANRM